MEEEVQPTRFNSIPQIRFLGFLHQPDSDSNPFELEESDVIWSPDLSTDVSTDFPNLDSIDSFSSNSSSPPSVQSHHSFRSEKLFGLSAALSEDHRSLVQRKTDLSPSFSRMIPPVSNPRSISSSDDYSGSYSGKFHQSAPINVPFWPRANESNIDNASAKLGLFEEEDEETEEEMLPPHEIVARSHSTTFSVFEGVGRTLKGRDLRRVRNAVWQKTGFLD